VSSRSEPSGPGQRVRGGILIAFLALGCGGPGETPFHPEPPGLDDPPLDRQVFASEVLPVFERRGCSSIHCHGSGTHPFPLTGGADPDLDFLRAADQVSFVEPAASLLLRKPLAEAAGGVPHNAPAIFSTEDDPDFVILARWVGALPDSSGARPASPAGALR
jgi:hypothetical protein